MTMQVSSASQLAVPAVPDETRAVDVTPDELFNFCEIQINNVGDEAKKFFNDQQKNIQAKNSIASALQALGKIQSNMGSQSSIDAGADIQTVTDAIDAAAANCPAIASQLGKDHATMIVGANGTTDTVITADEVKTVISDLTEANGQIDSQNQMLMIRMQSAMSAREQAIQLTTNMLQAVSDSQTKVISNIHA